MSFFIISRPSGVLKFTVIDRLFLLTARKYADSGGRWDASDGALSIRGAEGGFHNPELSKVRKVHCVERNTQRVSSPRETSSTLITSAPRSARSYQDGMNMLEGSPIDIENRP